MLKSFIAYVSLFHIWGQIWQNAACYKNVCCFSSSVLPRVLHSLTAGFSEGPSLSFRHLPLWDAFTARLSTVSYFNSTCQYLPVCPHIDPHFFDQWPSKCRRPLPDPAELHLCSVHQVGVPANQNVECWPHDSDTPWPQRYRPHCDKTGEAKTFFSSLFCHIYLGHLSVYFSAFCIYSYLYRY